MSTRNSPAPSPEIYILRDGESTGPYSLEQVRELLANQELSPSDLAWYGRLTVWIPLDQVLEHIQRPQPVPQVPALPSGQAFLICISGPDKGKRVSLQEDSPVTLGRSPSCNILSDDPDTSEEHLRISVIQKNVSVDPIGTATAFLDGQPFVGGSLSPRQQLRVGRSLWQIESPTDLRASAERMLGTVAGKITAAAGLEQIEGLRSANLFSAIFKKRSQDEFEAHFAAGTPFNTPELPEIDTRWPQPWAFFRAFLLSLGAFVGLYYTCNHFENLLLIPSVILVGSLAVPLSVLVLFYEINVPRNVSTYQVTRLLLIGGMFSILISMFLFRWTDELGLSWMGASVAGIVEESAKLAALLMVVRNVRYPWSLNGMLFGAAVGTSFAVFETAGYAFTALFSGQSMASEWVLFQRGILSPLGGHGILTAMVGAALWRAKRTQPFKLEMLKEPKFVRIFFVAVGLHMFWNSPFELPFMGKYLLIGFIAWVVVLSLVQMGLKEIREAQSLESTTAAAPDSELDTPEPTTASI